MKKIHSFFVILMMFILVNSGMCYATTMSGDKMVFEIPYIYSNGYYYTYNATEQTVDLNLFDSRYMTVSNNKRTYPGTQNVIVSLKDKENYIWANGTSGDIELEWKIKVATIYLNDYYDFEYDGIEKTLPLNRAVNMHFAYYEKLENLVTITGNVATDIGVYKANLSLNDKINSIWYDGTSGDKEFLWEIKRGKIILPEGKSVYYNNKEQYPGDTTFNYYNEELMEIISGESAIEIGLYKATIALKDKDRYEWKIKKNGDWYYTTEDQVIEWEIKKGVIQYIPHEDVEDTKYTYTKSEYNLEIKDFLYFFRNFETYYGEPEDLINITGNTGTNAGKYTATFSLKDPEHYYWLIEVENGDEVSTIENQTVEWEITKEQLRTPTLKRNLIYNGEIQQISLGNFDETIMNIEGNSAQNVGKYIATISLKNDNYEWRILDEETEEYKYTTEPIEIEWEIKPNVLVVPRQTKVQEYNGKMQSVELKYFDDDYMEITDDTAKECGEYVATVSLLDKDNYAWEVYDEEKDEYIYTSGDQLVEWRIKVCTIDVYEKIQRKLQYTGEEQAPEENMFVFKYRDKYVTEFDIPSDVIKIYFEEESEVGEYLKTIKLIDTENYRWRVFDGDSYSYTSEYQVAEWEIIPAELEIYKKIQRKLKYTGEEQSPEDNFVIGYRDKLWNEYELDVISISGDKGTNAGIYEKTISLLDKENYIWKFYDDEKQEYSYTTESQVSEWMIEKKTLPIPWQSNVLGYDGTEQTVYLQKFDENIMQISGDKATEIGIYTAEISLIDKENYCWNDGTLENKFIKWKINMGELEYYKSSGSQLRYNGQEQVFYPEMYDDKTMNIQGNSETIVGKYTAIISIKDTERYIWADGTSGEKTYSWNITKGSCDVDVVKRNLVIGVDTKLDCVSEPAITDGTVKVLYEVRDNGGMYSINMPTEEGLYKVKLYLTGDSNLLDSVHEEYIFMKKNENISNDTTSGDNTTTDNTDVPTDSNNNNENSGESGDTPVTPSTPIITPSTSTTTKPNKVTSSGGGGGGGTTTTKYKIVVTVGSNGNVSPKGNVRVEEGQDKNFKITPEEGYQIKDIIVDGKSVGKVSEYIFKSVSENHSFSVTFEKEIIIENETVIASGDIQSGDITEVLSSGDSAVKIEAFDDIASDDWYYSAVKYVVDKGLFKGVSENEFAAETTMNRAMIVTVLHRLAGEKDVANKNGGFTDVETDAYYKDAVKWAVENGIVNGINENEFAPLNDVTREQLVVMLYRYEKLNGNIENTDTNLVNYEDASDVENYAKEAFAWAIKEGIINGRTSTTLAPKGTATRAEVATILMRFEK